MYRYSFILFLIVSLSVTAKKSFSDQKVNDQRYESLKIFSDILNVVEQSYVQPVSTEELIHGAIKGMMKELDPHSYFLNAEELKKLETYSKGWFKGIGIDVAVKEKKLIIIAVFKDSPAWREGLKPGDEVVKMNNKQMTGLSMKEITEQINSVKTVKNGIMIEVRPSDSDALRNLVLKPEHINLKSIEYKKVEDQFLYIHIQSFTEQTHKELGKILKKNKAIRGMILDVRGNPGGLLDSAVKVADLFIKTGVIVSVKGRLPDYEQIFHAHSQGTREDFPLIVLIDDYSASAAEVLAGALKDSGRALVLGRNSFGKGSVQTLIPIENEEGNRRSLKLTVAHYYTPAGNSIHGVGVKPHIELKQNHSLKDKKTSFVLAGDKDGDFQQALYLLKTSDYFIKF